SLRDDPLLCFLCCFPLRFLLWGCAVIGSIVCENGILFPVLGFPDGRRAAPVGLRSEFQACPRDRNPDCHPIFVSGNRNIGCVQACCGAMSATTITTVVAMAAEMTSSDRS